jgi:hypothetical protein
MGKKCIPGLFCIENFTLFLILFLILIVVYLGFLLQYRNIRSPSLGVSNSQIQDVGRCGGGDPLKDPYVPPVKCDMGIIDKGIPINIPTQSISKEYTQLGILSSNKVVLPLLGRRTIIRRDKWQYYTISGGDRNLQTKLPIKVKGRNASSENGVDEIYTNDEVYVEGLKEIFIATIYETGLFSYIPSL